MNTPSFKVIGAEQIRSWIDSNSSKIISTVADCYYHFKNKEAICPDSYFLRYPNQPNNRIIALPGSIESTKAVSGIKWISSFPENINNGLDRASAVVILNDRNTGYPIACLEGSQVSSYRTAASAVLGAQLLHPTPLKIENLVIVGSGLIAKSTVNLLILLGWDIKGISIVDLDLERARHFSHQFPEIKSTYGQNIEVIKSADLVLFTTSAIEPYVTDVQLFSHNPTVLHISLRDISPQIIKESQNFVDNVDHAVKANTSLHLAEQLYQSRDFIAGDVVDIIDNTTLPMFNKPRIYSPFGMGILDVMLAYNIYSDLKEEDIVSIPDFFPEPYSSAPCAT